MMICVWYCVLWRSSTFKLTPSKIQRALSLKKNSGGPKGELRKEITEALEIQDEESEKKGTPPPYSPHFKADLHQIWPEHILELGEYIKGHRGDSWIFILNPS